MGREQLDVRSMVEEAVARVRDALGRDDVQVAVEGQASLTGDRAALVRAIENLVGNGLRHARTKVTVDIRPGAVRVRDDGAGFAASFDTLMRPHGSAAGGGGEGTAIVSGTSGIGLYLVRLITEAHGGRLVLEDTGPDGSTVGLHLGK